MTDDTQDLASIREEYIRFPDEFDSVLMATVSASNTPDASYAVYVFHDNAYYVYISELARHTENLLHSAQVCLMFIENEQQAQNLFARQRMTLECSASEIERSSTQFAQVLDLFEQRFGSMVKMLRSLSDFHLFRLEPQSGTYVRGFAQAYQLYGDGQRHIRAVNDQNIRANNRTMDRQLSDEEE